MEVHGKYEIRHPLFYVQKHRGVEHLGNTDIDVRTHLNDS
jgi:hypothetical protein